MIEPRVFFTPIQDYYYNLLWRRLKLTPCKRDGMDGHTMTCEYKGYPVELWHHPHDGVRQITMEIAGGTVVAERLYIGHPANSNHCYRWLKEPDPMQLTLIRLQF
jgi:hypothetical protein